MVSQFMRYGIKQSFINLFRFFTHLTFLKFSK